MLLVAEPISSVALLPRCVNVSLLRDNREFRVNKESDINLLSGLESFQKQLG
jgi:hypothetical protein